MYHISLVAHHIITITIAITIILGTTRTIRIQPPVLVVPFQPLTQAAIHRSSVVAFSSSLPCAGGSHRTQSPFSTIHPRRPYRYLHDTNRLIATTTNQMTPRNGEDETGAAVIEDGTEQPQKRPRSTRIQQQQQQQQQQQRANVTSVPMVVTPSPKKKRQRSTGTSTIATATAAVTSAASTVRSATPQRDGGSEQRSPRNVITPMDCPSSSLSSSSSLTASTTSRVPATVVVDDDYHDLYIPPSELRPSRTLITGQCFHWRAVVPVPMPITTTTTTTPATATTKNTSNTATTTNAPKSAWGSHNANEWIGNLRVSRSSSHHMYKMAETIIVMIRETPTTTLFRTIYTTNPSLNVRQLLYAYFQFTPSSVSILQQSTNPNEVVLPIETVASSDQYLETDTTANHHQTTTTTTICLTDLYQEWSAQCDRLSVIASYLPGVRIVDQDPFYCLVSFLCSSNNNIPRITKMLSSLQRTYGTKITTISQAALLSRDDVGISRKEVIGWDEQDVDPTTGDMIIYAFPSLPQLISSFREPDDDDDNNSVLSEANLRTKCGMGYRAKYLMETLQLLHTLGGERYLQELRHSTDPTYVQEQLLQFKGIGRKVADCIALFSLQQHNAIPVDVHVWNIARRDYQADDFWINSPRTTTSSSKPITTSTTKSTKTEQKTKSLTPTIYKQIGDLFRNKFPSYSGWAHSLLFVAELPSFRPALPVDIVSDMDAVRQNVACLFWFTKYIFIHKTIVTDFFLSTLQFREDEKARKVALKQKARNVKAEKEK